MTRSTLSALIFAAAFLSLPARTAQAIEECQTMPYTVHVIDGESGAISAPFRNYVDEMTAYMSALPADAPCADGGDLYFIYMPLIGTTSKTIDDVLPGAPRLVSPWLVAGERRIVFHWNERQFLMDQALLAGAKPTGIGALTPLSDKAFDAYVDDYADTVLLAASPEAAEAANAVIADRIPPDILWLLRHAGQSTRGPFGNAVQSAMTATAAQAAKPFTALSQALIARCPANGQPEVTYPTVFAVSGVFSTEAYRIDRLN